MQLVFVLTAVRVLNLLRGYVALELDVWVRSEATHLFHRLPVLKLLCYLDQYFFVEGVVQPLLTGGQYTVLEFKLCQD